MNFAIPKPIMHGFIATIIGATPTWAMDNEKIDHLRLSGNVLHELVIQTLDTNTAQIPLTRTCKFWHDKINSYNEQHLTKNVIFLGKTASGKSTLAHIMMGRPLSVLDTKFRCKLQSQSPLYGSPIDNSLNTKWNPLNIAYNYQEGIKIIHCPSLAVKDKSDRYYDKNLLPFHNFIKGKCKFIVPIEDGDFRHTYGQNVSSFFNLLSEMFVKQSELNSIQLVITKVGGGCTEAGIGSLLKELADDHDFLTPKAKAAMLHLFQSPNQIGMFVEPKETGAYIPCEKLISFLKKGTWLFRERSINCVKTQD